MDVTYSMPAEPIYSLKGSFWLIVKDWAGKLYTNQTGGVSCNHPVATGHLFLLDERLGWDREALEKIQSYMWDSHIREYADVNVLLNAAYEGMRIIEERNNEEAWFHVLLDFEVVPGEGKKCVEAVLTWPNSD